MQRVIFDSTYLPNSDTLIKFGNPEMSQFPNFLRLLINCTNSLDFRPDPEYFKQLDSTLKKNSSFVKKLVR